MCGKVNGIFLLIVGCQCFEMYLSCDETPPRGQTNKRQSGRVSRFLLSPSPIPSGGGWGKGTKGGSGSQADAMKPTASKFLSVHQKGKSPVATHLNSF